MANITVGQRGRIIENAMNVFYRTLPVTFCGQMAGTDRGRVALSTSLDEANAFIQRYMPATQRHIFDMQKQLGKDYEPGYFETTKYQQFLFMPKGASKHDCDPIEIIVQGDRDIPRKQYTYDTGTSKLHISELPEEFQAEFWHLCITAHRQACLAAFVRKFLDRFIPDALEARHLRKFDTHGYTNHDYVESADRYRHTPKLLARDWPLLVKFFPSDLKATMGSRSHAKKGQAEYRTAHEEYWVPIITEWLMGGLLLPDKQSPPMGAPGIYIDV